MAPDGDPGAAPPWPPAYPRVPHLAPSGGATHDDRVLAPHEADALLAGPVRVEEKADGANVAVWFDGPEPRARGRSVSGGDRGAQLGRLRAWLAERAPALRAELGERVLYGEWLWRRHTVAYAGLPDWFIGLDVLARDGSWLEPAERDALLGRAGIAAPPLVGDRERTTIDELVAGMGASALGAPLLEGVVVRRTGDRPAPRVAKLLRPGFARLGDDALAASLRSHNEVLGGP